MSTDYEKAVKRQLTKKNRWEEGIEHHPKSEELMEFLKEHDFKDYGDYFCWKTGGDGDNGESLMYQMDAFFESKEMDNVGKPKEGETKLVTCSACSRGFYAKATYSDEFTGWVGECRSPFCAYIHFEKFV